MDAKCFTVHWSRVRQKQCSCFFCSYGCSHFYFKDGSCLPRHIPFPPWSCLNSLNLFPLPLLPSLCFAPLVFLQQLYKINTSKFTLKFTLLYSSLLSIYLKIKVLCEEQSSWSKTIPSSDAIMGQLGMWATLNKKQMPVPLGAEFFRPGFGTHDNWQGI